MYKIAFDIGGVISKYPGLYRDMMRVLGASEAFECHVITDMHDRPETLKMLRDNAIPIPDERVHNSDYSAHGDACKAVVLRDEGIHLLVDDQPGYCTWPWASPAPIRLLSMPDPRRPYWADDWKCDGGEFGRRVFVEGGDATS